MGKEKQVFFCKECGYESSRWLGQCPGCRAWNTFVEEKVTVKSKTTGKTIPVSERPKATSIKNVSSSEESRILTRIGELDRVLGGGIVKGALKGASGIKQGNADAQAKAINQPIVSVLERIYSFITKSADLGQNKQNRPATMDEYLDTKKQVSEVFVTMP